MSFINHNPPDQGIALLSPKHEGINEKATPTVLAALGEPKVSEESLGESDRAIMTIVTGAVFLTQIYDTVLGGFISYTIMISIVTRNKALLVNGNGDASWGGANIQAYDTNATSWALASYLYKIGAQYQMVPIGMAIGAAAVVVQFVSEVRGFKTAEINIPQIVQYAGFISYNQSQTCLIFSLMVSGLFVQYYL
ncbi:cytochrome P450 [Penicillium atrosanguineum]|uniref:Uncharacterized protein n=1 Tax=Penicillium atrosanguineum TaxID=1132637 RepID=A0A9W9UCV4_9EURO|nr:cytochrome P450 [Penicillium atrosanguineum]KAJ5146773.1 hypothetical protein N7526_000125 [Penicillium atrosanguineum]KAJ5314737.1 cytochrome P450 [Penicillium atrosanguineum]KAJ5331907.1 hypothetical protein N7476_001690 [Penicillium atrosanguineum]